MSGKHGEDMLKGIGLYLRHSNLSDKPVELIIRDDKNDAAEAAKIAAEIAEDKRILAIIGRYSGSAYNSVTPIYKKYGIPVVTASSIITETEAQNEWYFSVVPDIAFQGSFIANYAVGMLKYTSVCIIHENNLYGTSLSKSFGDTAGRLGIPIHRKWSFESGSSSARSQQIIQELLSLQDRGIVFVAAGSTESAKLVSQLKSTIPELPIIGSNSFAEERFITELQKNAPKVTSDIYAVSYFIPDIAGETAYRFRKSFARVWHEEPSPEAACYYDATQTLIEAIHNAGIRSEAGHIRGNRRKVREALAGFYQMENSVRGITGDIYFDSRGSARKSLFVVRYENNGFVPAFSQYKKMTETDSIRNIFEKTLKGSNILIQGILMNEVRVIRTGIRINTVTGSSENEYTVDADLWFRFKGQFDNPDIEFTHSIHPVEMGTPIREYTADGITTRIYHIKAIFRTIPDYQVYPLDKQLLTIGFRHRTETRDQLIFISDPASSAEIFGKPDAASLPDFGKKWKTEKISFYTDVITNFSTLGIPKFFNTSHTIVYSRFNAEISAKRNDLGLVFKFFAPFVLIGIALFFIRFIHSQKSNLRLSGLLMIFIASIICHLKFFHEVPAESLLNADYFFFIIYSVIILIVFISVRSYARNPKA